MCEEDYDNSKVRRLTSVEEFKDALRRHELETSTKYVFWKGDKAFSSAIDTFAVAPRIQINWDANVPYLYVGARTYLCHQGKDINTYQKKKYAQRRDNKAFTEQVIVKRRNVVQPSKKVGCPARIHVTRIICFPTEKISSVTKTQKMKVSKQIKDKLANGEQLFGEDQYMFNLPDISEHQFHTTTETSELCNQDDVSIPLPKRKENRSAVVTKQLLEMCSSHMEALQTAMLLLEEQNLIELEKELGYLSQAVSSVVQAKEHILHK